MIDKFKSRMLNNLWEHLTEIERDNEWEYNFVTDLMEQDEKSETRPKLSQKQFDVLNRIHNKYMIHV